MSKGSKSNNKAQQMPILKKHHHYLGHLVSEQGIQPLP